MSRQSLTDRFQAQIAHNTATNAMSVTLSTECPPLSAGCTYPVDRVFTPLSGIHFPVDRVSTPLGRIHLPYRPGVRPSRRDTLTLSTECSLLSAGYTYPIDRVSAPLGGIHLPCLPGVHPSHRDTPSPCPSHRSCTSSGIRHSSGRKSRAWQGRQPSEGK